ncbi:DUF885 domain-containing protein [Glaciecola sp. 1036]|uniref:DUF885 domain-containing protein n=1 Tax=Alteromonadaceae TaxID=72275 RepID=UPI003D08D994
MKGLKKLSMVSTLVLLLVSTHQALATTASENLSQLLDEIWSYEVSQFPNLARAEGVASDSYFTDITMPAMSARNLKFKTFLQQLDEIESDQLTDDENISVYMQKYRLQNYVDQFEFHEYRVPITSEYGFHSSIASSISNFSIKNQEGLNNFIKMLSAVPVQFEHNIAYMKQGIAHAHVQPKAVLVGYEDTITPYFDKKFKQHPFYAPVKNSQLTLTDKQTEQLKQAINAASGAYKNFYDFFVNTYKPSAKDDIAAKTWPQGEEFYNNRIRYYTTTDLSAEEIHQMGLKEVARIRAEMQGIVDELEFDGDINAFINYLRTSPLFYAETPEELIINASYIAKKIDAKLPKLFYKLPRTPYGVEAVPDSIAPKYTTGRYISPRRDDQPGYYWVNTYALDKRPLYALPALTLHEAVPGHHLQISLAAEMDHLPKVRRNTYISAFGEGWGLYAEYLGIEVGMYEDPHDDFGRLSYEMWRACRLVVDTGMHLYGWSREKALNYMMENTALSEHNVRTEIDRYISWPAQALSYKIGELKIKELRAKAEQALGDKFDLRAFHDKVLASGSIPLSILENNINTFIATELEE